MKKSTLTDLANKCLELERLLGLEDWDYETFLDVKSKIDKLQNACPNEESILNARIQWFRRGIDNFKKHIPDMLETPPTNREHRVAGQTMNLYYLEHYLTRSHLHGEFSSFYREVMLICKRTAKAANKRRQIAFAGYIYDFGRVLESQLLDGLR